VFVEEMSCRGGGREESRCSGDCLLGWLFTLRIESSKVEGRGIALLRAGELRIGQVRT
jgi:hypothetical protein